MLIAVELVVSGVCLRYSCYAQIRLRYFKNIQL